MPRTAGTVRGVLVSGAGGLVPVEGYGLGSGR